MAASQPGQSGKAGPRAHDIPPPRPAYLPVGKSSPLVVDADLYTRIATAKRLESQPVSFTLPPRSGRAWHAPAKSIIRISTPSGPQVGDLNIWNAHNPRERFWAARTKQLHASHVSVGDRLWSCLPYMRPMVTIVADTLGGKEYGVDKWGGRCHDLLGTRCDPYINVILGGEQGSYDYHCHSNLVRAVMPFGLQESDVHDVINLFQVTGLDEHGRYFMNPSPAAAGDYIEFFAEMDVLMALSTCPGGDLSQWGFGGDSEAKMRDCCRPLKVEVWKLENESAVLSGDWRPPELPAYRGLHGLNIPEGEAANRA